MVWSEAFRMMEVQEFASWRIGRENNWKICLDHRKRKVEEVTFSNSACAEANAERGKSSQKVCRKKEHVFL